MDKKELKQLIREELDNLTSKNNFQHRMQLGKAKVKKERGIMMLMNRWMYDNYSPSTQWEIDSSDPTQINLFMRDKLYKTINLNDVITSYPDIANKYNLK